MPVEAKPLFRPDVLRPHLQAFELPKNLDATRTALNRWRTMLVTGRADKFKEQELLPDFLTEVFCDALGYTRPADHPERFTISREKHVQVDGKFADAVLGDFRANQEKFIVALEGKGPLDPLDRPFAGRKMSAVDQAYRYAINLPCDWLIVTSMRQTRLYFKGADQYTYERFDTEKLATDDALLKRFLFLLGAERVVPESGRCHLFGLLTSSEKVGKELTKDFYFRYAELRQNAFEQLCGENPKRSRKELLTATQKLLDRILFCSFCEDRGLLPEETIKLAYEHRDPYAPKPIWDNFRGLFRAIDTGNAGLNIPAYNGGLFAHDPALDDLKLTDATCDYFRELSAYDYRTPNAVSAEFDESKGQLVDVDILGHIFEQSITDLEQLRNEIEGLVEPVSREKHKTRRKKEGAFYTPAFITRYIVEQALGKTLRERFEQLRLTHETKAKEDSKGKKGDQRKAYEALSDPSAYVRSELTEQQRQLLYAFWDQWQDELQGIRILDPACGSGAFLVEAFDVLYREYQISNARLEDLWKRGSAARGLFDPDRQILQNNLYGVDLNEEAVEICRLSLWIKTAARGKTLTSLDHTIRVGNSVVADADVHARAFDWQAAFPEVFANGGFDVIVGNPPYIRQEWLAPFKPHWQVIFKSFHGVADIFTYFFELGLNMLRTGGRLGFITSGSWVRGNFGAPLRKFIAENSAIESMIDFGEYQPFEEAELIRPTIAILHRQQPSGMMRLFKWLTNGHPPENLSEVIETAPTMRTDHLGADAWELEPDNVIDLRKKLAQGGKPLRLFTKKFYNGIKTGLDSAFVVDEPRAKEIMRDDVGSASIMKPFVQGTHIRPWYCESSGDFLIFARRGIEIESFPAAKMHLEQFRAELEPRNKSADGRVPRIGRKAGTYKWYEIQDTIGYWRVFEQRMIVWPDITNHPRFTFLSPGTYVGMTAFIIPSSDAFLLGVLSSWATWFYISKTAQPLRLRSDRWQYRLKSQYLEQIPIPDASEPDRKSIGDLAELCCSLGSKRYELETQFQRRLCQTFGLGDNGESRGKLNNKAEAWWEQSLNQLGDALKTSFKLRANPFMKPQTADEWEPYLAEKRAAVEQLTKQLATAEAEINARVYKLFKLTPDEIKLLEREVEH